MTHVQLRPLQPMTVLGGGRYRLEREIGRGGMATVWLATDTKLNRDVAIKVLLGDLAFAMGPERFKREIEVVSRLSHPYILPIDDYGEYEGQLYYVMPYIAGETIHKRLEREKQLPVQDAIRIAHQVAMALDFAHQQGIVHRDIKPENILLQNGEALVADFGIARAITDGGGAKLTSTGVTLGTPTYMSPEQAMADPSLDGRSDIYSLGCVLYEMLAGQPPFTGPTAQAIIARHQLDEAPSLGIVRGTIPEEVEDIVAQAMAKLPADRYATAGQMADDLRNIMSTGARPARVSQSRRPRTTQRRRVQQQQQAKKRKIIIAAVAVPVLAVGVWAGVHFMGKGGAEKSRIGTDTDPNHIAVLYFEDQSDGKLKALAAGLTESLIDELGTVKQLTVISRNGVAPFKGKTVAPDSVQRALKVGTVVTGSVAESGDKLRVKVDLVDASNNKQLGTTTIERTRADLFALQDTLAKEVSRALRKTLGTEIEAMVSRPGTSNAQAWEAMQRANQSFAGVDSVLASGGVKPAVSQLDEADRGFAQVADMDKKWAAPIVQRGFIAFRKMQLIGAGDPTQIPKWLDVAAKYADQALAIAPQDADALELRGTIRFFRWSYNQAASGDPRKALQDAEADLKAATTANPLQATAWNGLSYVLNSENQFAQAKLAAQRAYESDPYLKDVHKTIWRLFQNSLELGSRTEAERWCTTGRQRFPDNYRFTECRLWLYDLPGKANADSVWKTYRDFLDQSPPNAKPFNQLKGGMLVALALIRAGVSPDSARSVATRSRAGQDADPVGELLVYEAHFRSQVGDKDEAIKLLTKFFANIPSQRAFAKDDDSWWWDPIREDPRYKALVSSSGR
jgi:eukaryotic-like serine/threonine-protein kinase